MNDNPFQPLFGGSYQPITRKKKKKKENKQLDIEKLKADLLETKKGLKKIHQQIYSRAKVVQNVELKCDGHLATRYLKVSTKYYENTSDW